MKNVTWLKIVAILICMMLLPLESAMAAGESAPPVDRKRLLAVYHDAIAAGVGQEAAMVSAVQTVSEQMYNTIVDESSTPLSAETVIALKTQLVSEAIVALATEVAAETHTDLVGIINTLVDAYNHTEGALVQVSMANVETATQHIAEARADAVPVVNVAPVIDESPMPEAIEELQEKMGEVLESSKANENNASAI